MISPLQYLEESGMNHIKSYVFIYSQTKVSYCNLRLKPN
jgi:hypothetical protein